MRSRKKGPESRLDDLEWQQQNTLSVFEVTIQNLDRIADEAEKVANESDNERARHESLVVVANSQAADARSKARKLRELFQ